MDLFDKYSEEELLAKDVNLFRFKKIPWTFSRGAKITKVFQTTDTLEDRIRVTYNYAYSDGLRVITPISKKYEWVKTDGTVGLEDTIPVSHSSKKMISIHRDIRQGQLDYLEDAAGNLEDQANVMPSPIDQASVTAMLNAGLLPTWVVGPTEFETLKQGMLLIASNIKTMFLHYDSQIQLYIHHGWRDFEDAINNETDATTLTTLGTTARNPDAEFPLGLTVKQSIIYQITGVKP